MRVGEVQVQGRLWILWILSILVVGPCSAARGNGVDPATVEGGCEFPERWQGSWFQSGVRQPVSIQGARFSTKGRCIESDGDKFLLVDDKGVCFRCVVVHEKHENVLQYKETYCSRLDSLSSLCSHITGDALLYSMFRVNAVPLACPFSGYHSFSYNRGHGECKTPLSTMESCTQESRLLLSYQACPDVYGSESALEELQCLATWKEGSSRYLVGKIEHGHVGSNEDRYRCFVYEKVGLGAGGGDDAGQVVYRVAQSGDATCNGLFSPMEGSRTMTLYRAPSPQRCKFPSWVTGAHWHSLDYKRAYTWHHRNTSLKVVGDEGREELRLLCSEIVHSSAAPGQETAHLVAHYTVGCKSGYVCLSFYRRDAHVIELQSGAYTRRGEEACTPDHFDRATLPYTTLVTGSPEARPCPVVGRYRVTGVRPGGGRTGSGVSRRQVDGAGAGTGCSVELRSLVVGCAGSGSGGDTMEFRSGCEGGGGGGGGGSEGGGSTSVVSAYTCHASWVAEGKAFLITTPQSRASHSARRYCFIFTPSQDGGVSGLPSPAPAPGPGAAPGQPPPHPPHPLSFSTSGETCSRALVPGLSGALAFNVSHQSWCAETSGAHLLLGGPSLLVLSAALLLNALR